MFKHAYVRGVQNGLVQAGHAQFPSEEDAAKVADYIADHTSFEPTTDGVPKDVTAKIAANIIDASKYFQKQAGFKAASFTKVATVDDLAKLAHQHALSVMQKAAEGSTIEGGDKGNKEPQSTTGEAKMDLGTRPEGYATDSLGKTDVDTKPGAVGKEDKQPAEPSRTDSKPNSVTDQSKTSSLEELIRKTAAGMGTTIQGGDKGNKEPTTAEGKMDKTQRPDGYAVLTGQGDLGELMRQFGTGSHIGKETTQPNAPARTDSKPNSVTETTHKSAAADPFIAVFQKTATEVVPHLPAHLTEEQKIAHVRVCMGLNTEERAHYLIGVQQKIAAATVDAVPPGSRSDGYRQHSPDATHSRQGSYDGRKNNQGKVAEEGGLPPFMMGKKDDDKKDDDGDKKHENPFAKKDDDGDKKHENPFAKKDDDKKEDDKKEASLSERMQALSAAVRAAQPTA